MSPSAYKCARCGLPVRFWYYGWKHSGGWGSKKSCGEKPLVVRRSPDPRDLTEPAYVYKLIDPYRSRIRCVNKEVARNVCLQLNLIGIPKDSRGYRLYDKVTWVVASA